MNETLKGLPYPVQRAVLKCAATKKPVVVGRGWSADYKDGAVEVSRPGSGKLTVRV